MNLPQFSVQRPVFTTMVTLIVVILGIFSLSRLQIDLLPDIELPTLTIRTEYQGASPEVMERLVTQVIEEVVATVPGVEEMTSQSSEGSSTVRVSFGWKTDIDTAAQDVRSILENEINELPDDVLRPRISKFDVASFPVVILGISSKLDPVELTELVNNQVRYRFGRLPGVAQVDLWGEFKREVRVELDPDQLKALAIPLDQILQAVRNANLDLPAGKIEQGSYEVTLRAPAEFTGLDQIRNTVIFQREGAAVTLGQIASVRDTYEKKRRIVRVNGERGLRVAIRKQADANTVEVAKAILDEIAAVNSSFPQIHIIPVINQGNFIERSIANVAQSVFYGGGLSILVLLFFLRNIRSTLVISLAIPISVIATFSLIYFGGFTLNLMTLGGLALGVGMMVDSSVVVLENIFRRRNENRERPETAAIEGAREVGPAIVASTITTLVIFLPLIFVRGVAGVLFQELSFVIIFSLICSLLVSLSLLPMLASRLLETPEQLSARRPVWIESSIAWSDALFKGLDTTYRNLLRRVLRHRLRTVFIAMTILGLSLLLLPFIGTEFMPPSDEGEVRVSGEMEIGTRLELLDQQASKMEKVVYAAVPEAISSVISVGSSGWRPSDAAKSEIRLSLLPASQRQRSNTAIANDLRSQLTGKIPGMTIRTRAPQGQFLLQRILGGVEGLTIEIRGVDLPTLDTLAARVAQMIIDIPGLTDIETSREAGIPQQDIRINRNKVADLGLSIRDVTEIIETSVAGAKAGDFRSEGNSYRIFVQLKDVEQRSIEEILDLTLTTPTGDQVALRNLVTSQSSYGPIVIDRKDQQRLVTIQANVADRDLGSVAAEVQEILNQIPRPVGYNLAVAGNFEEQQKAFGELVTSLLLALLLVYMVLACQYESLRDPIVVMASVPVAAVGVLVILFLTNTTLNLQSYIGCIMLGGIVVNNAILLVDQAGQLHRSGMAINDAVAEAGRRRLRPILMTTLTTILALLPLAFGIGEGADAQAPLARAVVGGLTGSTLITLVLIPAVYSLFHPESKGAEQ
ncbi:hydrophobic/amphiphilic exporter-1, HAE1 family [Desulfuromusa kysingii]|uniref:Hydrophobic/amphiphilic exporter-1, HAE1 family n=1 Tax=Desulfuromusa kysingii TaxID=37625 RepID=A0A1H3W171_9BACT|nr:efflux RND transporter permease subunit [Desulfuromusa kysingii]SDZ80651.1 hydrophobic/amphiphilic exporter-1, HAE1 family [Desulfuromusa kysingii]